MSTTRADFVSNVAGTQPPVIPTGDFLKMHLQFSQTSQAIYRSFNVSSLYDDQVGVTSANYINVMANTLYCGVTNASKIANWQSGGTQWVYSNLNWSQIQVVENGALVDSGDCSFMIAGLVA